MSAKAIGRRLRLIRLAKGYAGQRPLAERLGVSVSRYNNWEIGLVPVPVDYAAKLCAITGVTMDFLYRGVISGLPLALISALEDINSRDGRGLTDESA